MLTPEEQAAVEALRKALANPAFERCVPTTVATHLPTLLACIRRLEEENRNWTDTYWSAWVPDINSRNRLIGEERERWVKALAWAGDWRGLAPEVVGERMQTASDELDRLYGEAIEDVT